MALNAIITPFLILLLHAFSSSQALILLISGRECLSEYVEAGVWVSGSFVVIDVDSSWRDHLGSVDFTIVAPDGSTIYSVPDHEEDSFEFKPATTGIYSLCFVSQHHVPHTVELNYHIGKNSNLSDVIKDVHVFEMRRMIDGVAHELALLQQDQSLYRAREHSRRATSENTNRRIMNFAVLESIALIFASCAQIYLLKSMFEKRLSSKRPFLA